MRKAIAKKSTEPRTANVAQIQTVVLGRNAKNLFLGNEAILGVRKDMIHNITLHEAGLEKAVICLKVRSLTCLGDEDVKINNILCENNIFCLISNLFYCRSMQRSCNSKIIAHNDAVRLEVDQLHSLRKSRRAALRCGYSCSTIWDRHRKTCFLDRSRKRVAELNTKGGAASSVVLD